VLFAQRPYESVSTGEIAEAASTTRTNIHHHFRAKRDLFLEIVEPFSRIPDLPGPESAAEDRASLLLLRWLDAVERNRDIFMTILKAGSSPDPAVSGVLKNSMRAWERRLLEIVGMDPRDPAHRVMMQSYQAMVAASTAAWLEAGTLNREQVHSMLSACLIALGESARPTS